MSERIPDQMRDCAAENSARCKQPLFHGVNVGGGGNRLYRNRHDGTFEDVTAHAGVAGSAYGMGCAVGDYDGDGKPDLYVTNYGPNLLYRNNGDGTFTDVTASAGVTPLGGIWSLKGSNRQASRWRARSNQPACFLARVAGTDFPVGAKAVLDL